MRISHFLLATLKETPADAEIVSHRLMLRSGMISRLASGLYTWMPLGLRVLRNVENIIREEMDLAGAQEVLMPAVQPAELWEESGRWQKYGPELLRFTDRHAREFCFGPTHEEVITDLVRRHVRSYRQLPANFYQIQTKFRDEVRPRFGVMRAREFLMKDGYSFHLDEASLQQTYQRMYQAYGRILRRMGLDYRVVEADTGSIGGSFSHEFHVLAESGEDAIAFSQSGDFAANVELAEAPVPAAPRPEPRQQREKIATPGQHSIAEVSGFLGVPADRIVKTLLVEGSDGEPLALLLRGDHELNPIKAQKLSRVAEPLTLVDGERIHQATGCEPGSLGPINLKLPIIADRAVMNLGDFVCGANQTGFHYQGINWGRDLPEPEVADLRKVVSGDPSPDGRGILEVVRGIEVGHIFQLGRTYSEALNATVLDEEGANTVLTMGCYGIGVSRLVAAAIEQNHDERGIVWPDAIAPFQVVVIPINGKKSWRVAEAAEKIYDDLRNAGIEVLLDDRRERPGVMFADAELIGIPHRVVVAEKKLDQQAVEYKHRKTSGKNLEDVPLDGILAFIREKIRSATNSVPEEPRVC